MVVVVSEREALVVLGSAESACNPSWERHEDAILHSIEGGGTWRLTKQWHQVLNPQLCSRRVKHTKYTMRRSVQSGWENVERAHRCYTVTNLEASVIALYKTEARAAAIISRALMRARAAGVPPFFHYSRC